MGSRRVSVWEEPPAVRRAVSVRVPGDDPPLLATRPVRRAVTAGYRDERDEWMAALGEGPRPGPASVTGRQRLAWLATLLLLLALVLVLLAG